MNMMESVNFQWKIAEVTTTGYVPTKEDLVGARSKSRVE